MKQTKTKLLCLILAALMLLSGLTACGKDKEGKDSNLIKLGDYELLYKGACIMEDSDGNDAIVLTLDFTNNSKENASYLWSVDETVMQNGVELEAASIITDYENLETVVSDQFTDVAPGATLEVRTAFVLKDTTSEKTRPVKSKRPLRNFSAAKKVQSPLTRLRSAGKRSPIRNRRPPVRPETHCSIGGTANGTAGGR